MIQSLREKNYVQSYVFFLTFLCTEILDIFYLSGPQKSLKIKQFKGEKFLFG